MGGDVPSEMLQVAFERLQNSGTEALVVMDDGRTVGLITPESSGQMSTLDGAFAWSRARFQPASAPMTHPSAQTPSRERR